MRLPCVGIILALLSLYWTYNIIPRVTKYGFPFKKKAQHGAPHIMPELGYRVPCVFVTVRNITKFNGTQIFKRIGQELILLKKGKQR